MTRDQSKCMKQLSDLKTTEWNKIHKVLETFTTKVYNKRKQAEHMKSCFNQKNMRMSNIYDAKKKKKKQLILIERMQNKQTFPKAVFKDAFQSEGR